MAERSRPFEAGTGVEVSAQQWWQMAHVFGTRGVVPDRGGELAVSADGSGLHVTVAAGDAWWDGQLYTNDAALLLAGFENPDGANPRRDLVVMRLNWAERTGALAILTGQPAVIPTTPTPRSQPGIVSEMPLAVVNVRPLQVPNILAGDVTDARVLGLLDPWPIGAILDWPSSAAPPRGWVLCDGRTLAVDTCRALFAVQGSSWLSGDAYHFKVPDLRGRVAVALDNMAPPGLNRSSANGIPLAMVPGNYGGLATVVIGQATMPGHSHAVSMDVTSETEGAIHGHNVAIPPALHSSLISAGEHHHLWPATASGQLTGVQDAHHHAVSGASVNMDWYTSDHDHDSSNLVVGAASGGSPHAHALGSGTVSGVMFDVENPHSWFMGGDSTTAPESAHTHPVNLSGRLAVTGGSHGHNVGLTRTIAPLTLEHGHTATIDEVTSAGRNSDHVHILRMTGVACSTPLPSATHSHNLGQIGNTALVGGGLAHDNTQPWYGQQKMVRAY